MRRLSSSFALVAVFLAVAPTARAAPLDDGSLAPRERALAAMRAAALAREDGLVVRVRPERSLALRSRPGGPVVARVSARTEFGSPQTLGVVERRGAWLGVSTPAFRNGTLGWVGAGAASMHLARTDLRLVLHVSRRTLVLTERGLVVRRMRVGVGRRESPTPVGRFSLTDKLPGARYSRYYGCCILALSARQPRLPAGWRGGDRIAIHGTLDPSTIGRASSAGCPHASERDLRFLMRRLPLGTPVVVRP